MALSTQSKKFHKVKDALSSRLGSEKGLTNDQARQYVSDRGLDYDEFVETFSKYKQELKAGKTDFRPGIVIPKTGGYKLPVVSPVSRVAGQVVGGVGKFGLSIGRIILPEHIEQAIEKETDKIGKHIPDYIKEDFVETFDPYHGDGLIGGAEDLLGTLLEYANVYRLGSKGLLKGSELLFGKKGRRIPKVRQGMDVALRQIRNPKIRKRLKKSGKSIQAGVGIGAAMNMVDGPEEDFLTSLIEEYPETMELFEHLAINPDDPEALKYLDSFLNNAGITLPFSAIGVGANIVGGLRDARQGTARQLAQTASNMNNSAVEVSESSLSGLAKSLKRPARWAKENLTSRFGVDDWTLTAGLRNHFASNRAISEADGLAQDLRRTIKREAKDRGVNLKEKFGPKHKKFSGLTFEEAYVNSALAGDRSAIRYLSQNGFKDTNKGIKQMRDILDELSMSISDDLVKGKLSAYIKGNRGFYINRAYRVFDDPYFQEFNKLPAETQKGAITYLNKMGINNEDARWVLRELLEKKGGGEKGVKHISDLIGANKAGTSRAFLKRGKVPEEIRKLYGEIKDPYKSFGRTYEKLSVAKAEADFLHSIRQHILKSKGALGIQGEKLTRAERQAFGSDAPRFKPSVEAARRGFEPIGEVGQERVGRIIGQHKISKRGQNPLEDLYVSPEYRKFLQEGIELMNPASPLLRHFMKAKAATQTAKTVLSPATHGRNTMGNIILMVANGYNPITTFKDSFKVTANRLASRSTEELGKYIGKLQRLGIVDSSVKAQTLRKTAQEAFNFNPNTVVGKLYKRTLDLPFQKLTQLYGAEDDFFKIMHFEKTLNNFKKWNTGLTDDVLEEMAARQTRDQMPNYALVPKLIKSLRRMPVSDFAAWPSEVTRVSKNLAKQTYDDITGRSIRTLQREAKALGQDLKVSKELKEGLQTRGYQRLGGLTAAGLGGDVIKNYSMNLYGIFEDDVQALEKLSNIWEKGTAKYFLSPINEDRNGHMGVDFINIGPIDPFSYLKAPARIVNSALVSGKEMNNTDWNNLGITMLDKVFSPFVFESMITEAGRKAWQQSLLTEAGREEFATSPTKMERAKDVLMTAVDPFVPGFWNLIDKRRQYREGKEAARLKKRTLAGEPAPGVLSEFGYTMSDATPWTEFSTEGQIASWMGLRPQRLDITAGMRRHIMPVLKDIDNPIGRVKKLLRNPNLINPNEVTKEYIISQRQRLNAFQKLRSLTQAYDQLLSDANLEGTRYARDKNINPRDNALWYGLTREVSEDLPSTLWNYMDRARTNSFSPNYIPSDSAINLGEIYTKVPEGIPYDTMQGIGQSLEGASISDDLNWWEENRDTILGNK
jgi:hypothetical protein